MSAVILRHSAVAAILCLVAFGFGCDPKVNNDDTSLEVTVRTSLSTASGQGNGDMIETDKPDISDDGRYLVFTSRASNLVSNDTNNQPDVFRRDNRTRTTVLVSINTGGTASGNNSSGQPAISGDGRYVVFSSKANDVAAGDTDLLVTPLQDIFVRDMTTGATTLVSRASGPAGVKATADCFAPQIAKTGRHVVFHTTSENLDGVTAGGDDNDGAVFDVYRRDWLDPTNVFPTTLISVKSGFAPGTGNKGTGASSFASISSDGNLVAFESAAADLVSLTADGAPDNNGSTDVFLRNVATNRTQLLSVRLSTAPSPDPGVDGPSSSPSFSANGLYVVFRSLAGNLVAEDDGTASDIFRRDLTNSLTQILSVHTSGSQAGNSCDFPNISNDGAIVTWQSSSSNLVNGDANASQDCFVRNLTAQTTGRVSVSTFGGELNALSARPRISGDGRYVVFISQATNAADDDSNGASDLFLRGPPF